MKRTPIEVMKAMQRGSDYMRYNAGEIARTAWLNTEYCDVYIWRDGTATVDICGYTYELPHAETLIENVIKNVVMNEEL